MQIEIIDSHTGGEPTRVVLAGWPFPEGATLAEQREYLATHQDHLRRGVILEPRGSDVIVGALLVPPTDDRHCTGMIFFNNDGVLGMCGHGTIGVVETLRHLGRIKTGRSTIETPVGVITVDLEENGNVTLTNVESYLDQTDVEATTPSFGRVSGDIAWGGNWFYLVHEADNAPEVTFENRDILTDFTTEIRRELDKSGVRGRDGHKVDHVEVFGPPSVEGATSKNYVLCPGNAYDRSPCGTGTSAKLAMLYSHGKIKQEERLVQESITGSTFTGWVTIEDGKIIPHISGRAHITAQAALLFDEDDPFCWGIV